MSDRHQTRSLFSGPLVDVTDWHCLEDDTSFGAEECSRAAQVVFVRSGSFERRVAGESGLVDAQQVAFFNAGEPFRVRHPLPGGDRCTVITLHDEALREVLGWAAPSTRDQQAPTFLRSRRGCDARSYLHHALLWKQLTADADDGLANEELSLRLVCTLLSAGTTGADKAGADEPAAAQTGRRRGASTSSRHRDLAEAARRIVADRLADKLLLQDIADALDCSPFHLARVFSSETGRSLHSYRLALRLRTALQPVAEGDDLTRVALDHGFSSQAHFADAFRREFDTTPTGFRRTVTAAQLSKILKA